MKKIIVLCTLATMTIAMYGAYKGRVFVDRNRNGTPDKGEKRLSDILVSDGLNVTKTAKDGSFILPGHAKEKFIFITVPSGYKPIDTFYRRIQSDTISYDFAVSPYQGGIAKDGSHRFIHISDTEIHESPVAEHDDWVQNIRDYINNEGAAFIVHTGDICYQTGLKNHIGLMNTKNMNTQMFYCIGNHDLVNGAYGEEVYEQLYGPVFYSFDAGNTHYIVTPMLGGDYAPSYRKEEVYRWLKNDLALVQKGTPIMVFNHDLLTTGDSFVYGINDSECIDLDAHNLKAWIYGHWHINHIHKHKQAYSVCTSTPIRGGIDHSASAFRVMKVDEKGNFTSDLRYSYIDKSVKIASIDNLQAPILDSGKIPLTVNAYSSQSPVHRITYDCRVGDEKIISKGLLSQQTDFTWYTEMSLLQKYSEQLITVGVEVFFATGEKVRKESSFVYQPNKKMQIKPNGNWTNLLRTPQHHAAMQDTLTAPLQLAWVRNVGSNIFMTAPVIYNEKVYVATVDENNEAKAALVALELCTGTIIWKYPVRSSVKNTIAVSKGLVLAQDVQGNLYAVDANSGKLVWEKKLQVSRLLPTLIEGLVVHQGIVYAGSGMGLCAVDVKTGKELWKNNSWHQNQGSTATMTVNDSVLISSSHWGELLGNEITTGKLKWRINKDGIRHRSSSAVMYNDVFYLTSDRSLFVMEIKTGRILVRKELPYNVNVASAPLLTDREIIFGTADQGLVALDRETLEEKWNYYTQPAMIYTSPYVRNPASSVEASPVAIGRMVFFGGADGMFYVLNKNDGRLIWKHSAGTPIYASVAVSGNTIVAVDFGGNVYAFCR